MGIFLRGLGALVAATLATMTTVWAQTADPPARIGRLAFINGTVSFHDRDETNWAPAALNYPMTSGNALWTEPNGRAELFVGGTRIRMQGSTQLETLALTDDQFRLRVSQGRIDVKPVGLQQGQQIEVLTPRGSAMLIGDGDYMIEAGTTDDATRVGVRAGSARVIASNGSELIVHAGEIGVLSGTAPPVFEVVRQASPPMPPEWAARDRQLVSTQSVQYVPTTMTGYEELDYYGTWSTVGDYGRVWSPRTVPVGWEPYRQGRWRWVEPWGWTWIDEQPWGFAPSHYGRWVNQAGRWYWVPPARDARPVYAPAVVGFVDVAAGAATLAIAASLGAPVAWFPLGPREVYVPPYTADRAYIRRVNAAYVRNEADIDRRIDYAERYRRDDPRRTDPRRDARPGPDSDRDRPTFINQRFATVVPQQAFLRGDRADRAAIRVDADRLARVQAAPVAAPVVSATVTPPTAPGVAPVKPGAEPKTSAAPAPGQPRADVQRAPLADIPVLGRPNRQDRPVPQAPGPQISRIQPAAPGATAAPADRQLPNLRTRDGRDVDRPAPNQAAPATPPATTTEPPKPSAPPAAASPAPAPATPPVAAPPAKPGEPPKAAEPPKPPQAPAAPPVAAPPAKPSDAPKAAEPPKPPQAPAAPPVAAPPKPPVTPPQAAEPPKPPQAPVAPPVAAPPKPPVTPPQAAEPPKAPVSPPKAAQPPSPPAAPPVQQAKPPEPPRPAPQAAPQAQPRPQPPAPPAPPPQQAKPPAPPAPPPQAKPPEQAKQPPGRDRDDKGGDDRRR